MLEKKLGTLFGRKLAFSAVLITLAGSGCQKRASRADPAGVDLVALNQLLHQYVVQKKEVPMRMEELVSSGFVSNLPFPPPGTKLVIIKDAFGCRVVLADQAPPISQ